MVVSDTYLLKLWREKVSKDACEVCGHAGEDCDPHHVFSREYKSVRYDPQNGVWLCNKCHRLAEQHRILFIYTMIGKRGRVWWEELTERRNKIVKFNNSFREDWKKILTERNHHDRMAS